MTPATLSAMFRYDLPGYIIGTILCTIGVGVVVFSPRFSRRSLVPAGFFALLYGLRMIVRTETTAFLLGQPASLPYVASALEYLVPIPASIVFEIYLGERWRRLNQLVVLLFVAVALIAIPYEVVQRQPHAANGVANAVVIALMAIFLFNYATQPRLGRNAVTLGALIFGLFVINEHFRLVPQAPFRLSSEPIGFLIFIGFLLYDLLRRSERAQWRLAAVESELATARRIQESILPRSAPSIHAIDVASVYLPASTVAGDYYDFVEAGDDCFGVVVADVSGHGVGSALVASMLKVAIAMQAEHLREPARLLAELNAFFVGKLERQFITAVVAFIDGRTGHIALASAGHPPPLLRRADGAIEELAGAGFVLGRMRDVRYEATSATLGRGDAIVFYTDGVTEARRGEDDFGEERLKRAMAGSSSQQIAESITRQVRAWGGDDVQDDVTLVVVRRSDH